MNKQLDNRHAEQGSIKPSGWLLEQMQKDLKQGFVGYLPQLTPDLFADDIYGSDRLSRQLQKKDVGALSDDDQWDVQYLWWNSETQSNYWDGFIRHAFLVDDKVAKQQAADYVQRLLATQDADGYLGIYDQELRFRFQGENGELWAQASLLRGLLHYYEFTRESDVLAAVIRAVAVTMQAYPRGGANPFAGTDNFAGVSHGLMFVDVLIQLERLTHDEQYQSYAIWLYEQYSQAEVSEADVQWPRLIEHERFAGHGVHTYEHLRVLAYVALKSQTPVYVQALQAYLAQLPSYLTPSGGPIGDEWIYEQVADATVTGYEYCSILELLDSYRLLLELTGDLRYADASEWLFFNAAQGARHPYHSGIAYLKTDNSYAMMGAFQQEQPHCHHEAQTRYQYSPTHQEAAVCCVPNAGRLAPTYLQMQWTTTETGFQANVYGASRFQTRYDGVDVTITQQTNYPFNQDITFVIDVSQSLEFTLTLRKPQWLASYQLEGEAQIIAESETTVTLQKVWHAGERVTLKLAYCQQVHSDQQQQHYYSYGPLLYALPIQAQEYQSKTFSVADFANYQYQPTVPWQPVQLTKPDIQSIQAGRSWQQPGTLTLATNSEELALIPIGATILRQTTFVHLDCM